MSVEEGCTSETSLLTSELLELCHSVVAADSTVEDAFKQVQLLQKKDANLPSVLLDVLAVFESEASGDESLKRFLQFLDLLSETVIPDEILRSELEVLEANQQANKQQLVRAKTRLFFKQSKFNLLREESEGYAKLMTEFLSSGTSLSTSSLMTRILCLIGTFNLDPNRVTDVILEAFEHSLDRTEVFIALLREMKANTDLLCTLIAFKFSFYQKDGKTPFSLYRVSASLIETGLLNLEKIASFITPNQSELLEAHKARSALASVRSKKAETIFTSNIAIDPHKSSSIGNDGLEPSNIVGISFSAVLAQQESEDAKLQGSDDEECRLAKEQRLGLCCALLENGSWQEAKFLLESFPEFYAVQSSRRICVAITSMVDASISEMFQLKCLSGFREEPLGGGTKDTRTPFKVTSWSDFAALWEMLSYLGPRLACRPSTLTKLIRLTTTFYEEKEQGVQGTEELSNGMMDMVDEYLLPSLSLCDSNAALSEEMWLLLRKFHYTLRYRLYGRWKSVHSQRHPEILIERGKTMGRTKYVLKRLSKDTVRLMGRLIGKLCHSQPAVVFDCLLAQAQTFDNFIQPIVEAMKFLTTMEFDVLAYCIMEQLSSPSKDALKATDGTTSIWLSALASMVGALYKKYNMELAGILNYIANQLKNGKSFDLLILRELIHSMTGIENAAGATVEQREAMTGGEILRNEAGSFLMARNKKATARLKDAVLKEGIAAGMCILIAQQREAVLLINSENIPLKLIGELADQCRDTFIQFGSFLLEHVKTEDYSHLMPSLGELLRDFFLPLDAAFFLTRSIHIQQIYVEYERTKKSMKVLPSEGEGKETVKEKSRLDSKQKISIFKGAFDEKIKNLSEQLEEKIRSGSVSPEIKTNLLAIFWLLTTHDIEVPVAAYERERDKIRKMALLLGENLTLSKTKKAKEEERLRSLENKLLEEEKKQLEHVNRVKSFLRAEKDNLFIHSGGQQIQSFLQLCVLPRAMFSEQDAMYSAKMVLLLHQQRTVYFQTVLFIDKTFGDLSPIVQCCQKTKRILSGASYRVSDGIRESIFEKECDGFPGFMTKVKNKAAGKVNEETDPDQRYKSHAKLFYKWQSRLYRTFSSVISSTTADYVHIRNSLVIMNRLLPCFPVVRDLSEKMEAAVNELRDREKGKRDDLALKAASYCGQLKIRKIPLHEEVYFHTNKASGAKGASNGTAASKRAALASAPALTSPVSAANGGESAAAKKEKERETEKRVKKEEGSVEDAAIERDAEEKKLRENVLESIRDNFSNEELRDEKRKRVKDEAKLDCEEGEVPPSPPASKKTRTSKAEEREKGKNGSLPADGKRGKSREKRIVEVEGPALPPSMKKENEDKEKDREKEKGRDKERERERGKRAAPPEESPEEKKTRKKLAKEGKIKGHHHSPITTRKRTKSPERRKSKELFFQEFFLPKILKEPKSSQPDLILKSAL